jgi:triosephosphate isomerase
MFEPYSIAREKLFKSLNSKCNTILCVGEENRSLRTFAYIKKELNYYLKSIESTNIKYLSICYTPSYALSSADKSVDSIRKIVENIKKFFSKKFGIEIDVYYGGNIEISNVKEIYDICDGIMLGNESVDIKLLKELLKEL